MTSRRLGDKKSVGKIINETRTKVQKLENSIPSPSAGIADQAIKSANIGSGAVDNSSLGTGSITADKLASGSFNPSGQNIQRVPAPLTSVEYWSRATAGNIPTHKEGYFLTKENLNVSATENGILFSPENSSTKTITYRELALDGATLTTSVAHGYEIGDKVTVSSLGSPFDGTWSVTAVDSTANTFTYNLNEYYEERVPLTSQNYIVSSAITNVSNTLSNITYTANNTFKANQLVSIYEINPDVFNLKDVLISSANATHFVVYDETNSGTYVSGGYAIARPTISSDDSGFDIAYKSLENSDGVVTITTTTDHSFLVDEVVDVVGLGSPYDGTYVVSEIVDGLPRVVRYDINANVIEREAASGTVKVQAESRLFLTGKHPVPVSKKLNISWISSNEVPVYIVYWKKVNNTDVPVTLKVSTLSDGISLKQGSSVYEWNVPLDAEFYSVYVEVAPDSQEFYLQDCAVFELVGDKNIKSSRISSILIENHVVTITTAEPHAFVAGDSVTFSSTDYATPKLNGATLTVNTVPNTTSFVLNSSVSVDPTDNALNLNNTSGTVDMTDTLALATGTSKQQSTEIGLSGITYTDPNGGVPINLTTGADKNFFGLYNDATGKYEATIDEDGNGVFSSVKVDHLIVNDIPNDGIDPIKIGSSDLAGSFLDARYNNTDYTDSLLNRLARGLIYTANWKITDGQVVNTNAMYFGLGAGSFQLEDNRSYFIHASSAGMMPNTDLPRNTSLELVLSTAPLRANASIAQHLTHTVPSNQSTGWRDLSGTFLTVPSRTIRFPFAALANITGSTTANSNTITSSNTYALFKGRTITVTGTAPNGTSNITTAKINSIINLTAFTVNTSANAAKTITFTANEYYSESATATPGYVSRASGNTTAVVTIPSEFGEYLKTNAVVRVYYLGTNTSLDGSAIRITKINNSAISYLSGASTAIDNNLLVSVELIDPVLTIQSSNVWSHTITSASSNGTHHTYTSKNLFQPGQEIDITGYSNTSPSWNQSNVSIVFSNATHFIVAPSSPVANGNTNSSTQTAKWSSNQYSLNRQYLVSGVPIYWILRFRHSSTTANSEYSINLDNSGIVNGLFSVSDVGQNKLIYNAEQTKPWTTGYPRQETDANAAPTEIVTYIKTVNASNTAYYDSYGKGTGTTNPFAYRYSIYQGTSNEAGGVKKSVIIFPDLGIANNYSSVEITKLELYLHNKYSYMSSGLTAYIGAHNYTSLPASSVSASNIVNTVPATTATFSRGEGKWISLPSTWYSSFADGTAKGILLGLTNSSTKTWYSNPNQLNYGYFDGVDPTTTLEDFPRLRVTYKYVYTTVSTGSTGSGGGGGGLLVT